MPRYDDRYGNTRLYVGRLSSRTRTRDLESLFSRYGRVRDVDMKHDFAFVEFSDPRDADDARYSLNGRDFDGSHIIVEFAKGGPRGSGGSREYLGQGPPPGSGRCFNCGIDGHWARDCKAGDWKNKCYRCGERGHIERNCQNSPRKLSHRGRSYSRSPVRSRHGGNRNLNRNRSRSRSYGRSRSYSRSRSPPRRSPPKRDRSVEPDVRSGRASPRDRSPEPRKKSTPPPTSKPRKASPMPEESRALESGPNVHKREGPEYSQSPRVKSRSPLTSSPRDKSRSPLTSERDRDSPVSRRYQSRSPSDAREKSRSPLISSPRDKSRSPLTSERDMDSPVSRRYQSRSPSDANGRNRSSSPKEERSPVDEDDEGNK